MVLLTLNDLISLQAQKFFEEKQRELGILSFAHCEGGKHQLYHQANSLPGNFPSSSANTTIAPATSHEKPKLNKQNRSRKELLEGLKVAFWLILPSLKHLI
ncbi:hypothetical protein ACQUW5_12905 [Legionella sp. CNM-1927-20]|uniref:hypothetical protein n=1 Tax=Legionella sp. CNM-1927-20 TaxID=3422221 RepID=UPI00403ABFFF